MAEIHNGTSRRFSLSIHPGANEDISHCFRQLAELGDLPIGLTVEVAYSDDLFDPYLSVSSPVPLTEQHRRWQREEQEGVILRAQTMLT